jgi:hypothetical protein
MGAYAIPPRRIGTDPIPSEVSASDVDVVRMSPSFSPSGDGLDADTLSSLPGTRPGMPVGAAKSMRLCGGKLASFGDKGVEAGVAVQRFKVGVLIDAKVDVGRSSVVNSLA